MIKQQSIQFQDDLRLLKNEVELQIPLFIKTQIMESQIGEMEEKDKAEIFRMLHGPKFENSQQFILCLPEYLIKHVLKLRKLALVNQSQLYQTSPQYLGQLLYLTLLPYEDVVFSKFQVLGNIIKEANFKIMEFFEGKKEIIQKLKLREIHLQNLQYEDCQKKKTIKHVSQVECSNCLCQSHFTHKPEQPINNNSTKSKCLVCKLYFHNLCLQLKIEVKNFICPQCLLCLQNPLIQVQGSLLQPQLINLSESHSEKTINFECPRECQQFQIQLRCILIDDGQWVNGIKRLEDGELFVNHEKFTENDGRQKHKPYILNQWIKFGRMNKITIMLSFQKQLEQLKLQNQNNRKNQTYLITIQSIEKLVKSELIMELQMNTIHHLSTQMFQNSLIKYFSKHSNQSTVKINLKCPISFSLMKIPGKGNLCKHISCFDIDYFIIKNSENQLHSSWKCPICDLVCYQLIIDDCLQNIITNIRTNNSYIVSVEFDAEGQIVDEEVQILCAKNNQEDMHIEL